MPAASEQNSHFTQVCPERPTAIHLCSPFVIQLHTLAPATDAADRFLIILSLSARPSVGFKAARNVVVREDGGMTLANDRGTEKSES